jgi:hypothetical protein
MSDLQRLPDPAAQDAVARAVKAITWLVICRLRVHVRMREPESNIVGRAWSLVSMNMTV